VQAKGGSEGAIVSRLSRGSSHSFLRPRGKKRGERGKRGEPLETKGEKKNEDHELPIQHGKTKKKKESPLRFFEEGEKKGEHLGGKEKKGGDIQNGGPSSS